MPTESRGEPVQLEIPDGTSCSICYEDVTKDNAVAYRPGEHDDWALSSFCIDCVRQLLSTQYHRYIKSLQTTTCAREQRALLERGPPINISDHIGFPLSGKAEVYELFDVGSGCVLPAKLDGSLIGEEREKMWEELKKFKFTGDREE